MQWSPPEDTHSQEEQTQTETPSAQQGANKLLFHCDHNIIFIDVCIKNNCEYK